MIVPGVTASSPTVRLPPHAETKGPGTWAARFHFGRPRQVLDAPLRGLLSYQERAPRSAAMFRPEEIREHLRRGADWVPLRLRLTDGRDYVIDHPDLLMVGDRSVVIGFGGEPGSPIFRLATHAAIAHIVSIEPLEVKDQATAQSNGPVG